MAYKLEPNRYGPTAARSHSATPKRRKGGITIDIHSHIALPEAAEYAKPYLDLQTIPLVRFSTPETGAINRQQDVDRTPVMVDVAKRLADMDAMGIDLQLVMSPPPQCYYNIPDEHAVRATRMVNDGIAAFVAKKPDRLMGLGSVPLTVPSEVTAELERVMGPLGLKGVQILTNVAGKELSDPSLEGFWAAAERLGAVVLLHPNGFTHGDRLTDHYFNNVIGNPFETTLALHRLIFDGVLLRYPKLKILAVHGGGYLAAYSGRIDHAWGARKDAQAKLPEAPTTYLKRVYFDSVVFTPHQLRGLVEVFGADHVMMGTDYPYDMAEYEPVDHILSAGLSESDANRLLAGNAAGLLGLKI